MRIFAFPILVTVTESALYYPGHVIVITRIPAQTATNALRVSEHIQTALRWTISGSRRARFGWEVRMERARMATREIALRKWGASRMKLCIT